MNTIDKNHYYNLLVKSFINTINDNCANRNEIDIFFNHVLKEWQKYCTYNEIRSTIDSINVNSNFALMDYLNKNLDVYFYIVNYIQINFDINYEFSFKKSTMDTNTIAYIFALMYLPYDLELDRLPTKFLITPMAVSNSSIYPVNRIWTDTLKVINCTPIAVVHVITHDLKINTSVKESLTDDPGRYLRYRNSRLYAHDNFMHFIIDPPITFYTFSTKE